MSCSVNVSQEFNMCLRFGHTLRVACQLSDLPFMRIVSNNSFLCRHNSSYTHVTLTKRKLCSNSWKISSCRYSESSDSNKGAKNDVRQQQGTEDYDMKSSEQLLSQAVVGTDVTDNCKFPSDDNEFNTRPQYSSYNDWNRDQSKHSYRPRVDPSTTSVLLFPGQGSQFKGMGKKLLQYPNVPQMFDIASGILGYDLLDICLNGPDERLKKTAFCQPAIYVTSLAAIEKLKAQDPKAIENCITTAGFSVGELAALAFAGVLTFEDGLQLVKTRAEAMQRASEATQSGMMTVFLRPESKLKFACHAARRYCSERLGIPEPVCEIANYLYPECKVVAGHEEALQFLEKAGSEFGLRRFKRLPVSGAFHTALMRQAAEEFKPVIQNTQLAEPIIPVLNNVTSHKYGKMQSLPRLLTQQIYKPVKWEQIMHVMYERPSGTEFPRTFEMGPGAQLGALLKMVNRRAWEQYRNIEV